MMHGIRPTYARLESRMPRVVVCRVNSDPSPLCGCAQRAPAFRGLAPTATCRRHFVADVCGMVGGRRGNVFARERAPGDDETVANNGLRIGRA
jgi:hypothetical protein